MVLRVFTAQFSFDIELWETVCLPAGVCLSFKGRFQFWKFSASSGFVWPFKVSLNSESSLLVKVLFGF